MVRGVVLKSGLDTYTVVVRDTDAHLVALRHTINVQLLKNSVSKYIAHERERSQENEGLHLMLVALNGLSVATLIQMLTKKRRFIFGTI